MNGRAFKIEDTVLDKWKYSMVNELNGSYMDSQSMIGVNYGIMMMHFNAFTYYTSGFSIRKQETLNLKDTRFLHCVYIILTGCFVTCVYSIFKVYKKEKTRSQTQMVSFNLWENVNIKQYAIKYKQFTFITRIRKSLEISL